jgi:Ca-activated chloride channel family protein
METRINSEIVNGKDAKVNTIALKSVQMQGQLDGLMLSMIIQQRYRNETGKNLELVYTFPLAWGATLMGMDVEIAGKRLQAVVLEKKVAVDRYEQSIDDGDAPVMVEQSATGLYTANLGNIKDRESVTVEIRYAQLLRFEQGHVRLSIPTAIAPRYGDAHKTGGLAAHESDEVSLLAEYPLSLKIDVSGQIALAKIGSPSHKISTRATETGITVALESDAMLDRDFILTFDELKGQSFALLASDDEEHTMLTSFCPNLPARKAEPLLLKILTDCSGSMGGDSIQSAKFALRTVLQELTAQDFVSYSRFGSEVQHETNGMLACSSEALGQLASAIAQTNADLGGTEMQNALLSTFKNIAAPQGEFAPPNVLLITDGDVWDVDGVIKAALKSGQRIFAVGVGSAPAESLLRELAEKTGGACELVSPNDDIVAAVIRMFHRMRGNRAYKARMVWGEEPVWQTPLPVSLYDGETIHLFARFAKAPVQIPALTWELDGQPYSASPEVVSNIANEELPRLAGAKQMALSDSQEEALALALKYQLVSEQTNLFLAHVRDEKDKAKGLPVLQQVPQMMAAGHGGFGTAHVCCYIRPQSASAREKPQAKKAETIPAYIRLPRLSEKCDFNKNEFEIPASLHHLKQELVENKTMLTELRQQAVTLAYDTDLTEFVVRLSKQEQLTEDQVWALILDWMLTQFKDTLAASRQEKRELRACLKTIDPAKKAVADKEIAKHLATIKSVA